MTVGGSVPNRIAFNRNGILVESSSDDNALFANDLFSNDALPIDLVASGSAPDGATPDDPNDGDSGGNALQNFPVLSSALLDGPVIRIVGTLDVPAGNSSKIYGFAFYASASCGSAPQGEVYLGAGNASLSGANQEFAIELPAAAPIGGRIAATATAPSAGTSEFSFCITLAAGDHIFADGFDL